MENHFLDRFLLNISNKERPKMSDLELVAKALIEMHDYGVSFKKAFGLTGTGGPKPKIIHTSNAFKSMSDGFLGNPLYLNSFLSKVDQGSQPKREDLEKVAGSLLKMRDKNDLGKKVSIEKCFGIIQKTGWKKIDIHNLNFNTIYSSEKWIIYHAYKKYWKSIKKPTDEVVCELVCENVSISKQIKGGKRDIKYSTRQIQRIMADLKPLNDMATVAKSTQGALWKFYLSNKNSISNKLIQDNDRNTYHSFHRLYQEVVIKKKYCLITRGSRDYPMRLTKKIDLDLKPFFDLVESVHAINTEDHFYICMTYNNLIKNSAHKDVVKVISNKFHIPLLTIECFLKLYN